MEERGRQEPSPQVSSSSLQLGRECLFRKEKYFHCNCYDLTCILLARITFYNFKLSSHNVGPKPIQGHRQNKSSVKLVLNSHQAQPGEDEVGRVGGGQGLTGEGNNVPGAEPSRPEDTPGGPVVGRHHLSTGHRPDLPLLVLLGVLDLPVSVASPSWSEMSPQ